MEDPEFFEEAQLIDVREPDEMCVSIQLHAWNLNRPVYIYQHFLIHYLI